MALPEIKRAEANRDLEKYCADNPLPEFRDQIRYTYTFRGNDVTLFEERPPWDGKGFEWTKVSVARFRYEPRMQWLVRFMAAREWAMALLRLDWRDSSIQQSSGRGRT